MFACGFGFAFGFVFAVALLGFGFFVVAAVVGFLFVFNDHETKKDLLFSKPFFYELKYSKIKPL